jgi:hypothetical protein
VVGERHGIDLVAGRNVEPAAQRSQRRADQAAATGFVARMRGPLENDRTGTGLGGRPRRGEPGRPAADDSDVPDIVT